YYVPQQLDVSKYYTCRLPKFYIQVRNFFRNFYNNINNVTNCVQGPQIGNFHKWIPKDKTMICEICNVDLSTVTFDPKLTQEIIDHYYYVQLQQLALKYCADGTLHNYIYDQTDKCTVCNKCKYDDKYKFSTKELDQLQDNVRIQKDNTAKYYTDLFIELKKEDAKVVAYNQKVITNLESEFNESLKGNKEDYFNFIDTFIDNIQSVIGIDTNINNEDVYLKDNAYIIDHDYLGYPLDKPVVITDKDNKIFYKQNHPFFKTDVIYYTSFKVGKVDVFYDATTFILLGFKESNKEYVLSKKPDKKIKINYSISNRLKYLGYPAKFIDIRNKIQSVSKKNTDDIIKDIVENVSRDRIHNLKKVIYDVQRYLYRVKNNYKDESKEKEKENKEERERYEKY
ncbi:MAG: hypothetical protein Edafosvirus47_1, partial [Edafosvirus sp.]